jgi:hypothetical protein
MTAADRGGRRSTESVMTARAGVVARSVFGTRAVAVDGSPR